MSDCLRVLVVEDSEDDALLTVNELELAGFEVQFKRVETADAMRSALSSDGWDLVLADYRMPHFSGKQALELVRDHGRDIPFILVSGKIGEETAVEAMKAGAHDYVMKDNLARLVPAVQRELREAEIRRERRRASEALRQSEERFRTVFETATDCIFIRDRNMRYTHVNPAMEKAFGLPASKVVGRTAEDLFSPEQTASFAESNKRVLNGEIVDKKHILTCKGINFTFHTILVPLRNAAGEVAGACGISRDISHLEKMEFHPREKIDQYTSGAMKSTLVAANLAATMDSTVLLLGESGSGKDHLARYIHNHSKRAHGPYFSINCAAISPQLAESELFGHERGAFTGAVARKRGLLELAEGGTLLLNEIGELSLALQSKLLTFLDTRKFTRVGGEKEIFVNARLMAATNKDLASEVGIGAFRKDLFYRLNVMSITVPSLRERREDIPTLVGEFLAKLRVELQLPDLPTVDQTCLQALKRYAWPGNVRELRNILERALILSQGKEIDLTALGFQTPEAYAASDWSFSVSFPSERGVTEILEDLKAALTEEALRRSGGSRKKAARMLGISRDSFYRYMKLGNGD
jgi:two-component system, NtrC family, response regulator AtoC